jgi:hypothetical protein
MRKRIFATSIALLFMLTSCATAEKSTLLGTAIGAGIGGGLGLAVGSNGNNSDKAQGALVGVVIGGLVGALIGHESYKDRLRKDQAQNFDVNSARLEMFGSAADQDKKPTLKPAQVKVRYVEDQIKDGTFVPAHFEYLITEPARWEPSK